MTPTAWHFGKGRTMETIKESVAARGSGRWGGAGAGRKVEHEGF